MASDESYTKRVVDEPPLPGEDTLRVPRNLPYDQTRRVILDEPPLEEPERMATLGYLHAGETLLSRFEVVRTLSPHETERPGVFICRAGHETVVVKVAALRFPPKQELWDRLSTFEHPNVLRVFETREEGGLFYEVQEYCKGGSLADRLKKERFDPEWVMSTLVPQLNEGLKYLHENGIVHRDIKPANLYLKGEGLNGGVVLGDFDISSVLASNRTSRDTKRNAGTWEYMPPEGFPRFVDSTTTARVTRTADYYSLGITLIELVLGTTSLHASELPDLFDFYLSGGQIEMPSGPPRFVQLLRGLLIRDRHKRWSGEQVDRWIAQNSSYEDVQSILDDEYFSLKRAVTPYSIQSMHATDLAGLADMLDKFPDEGMEDLLRSNRLTNWIAEIDMNLARAIERDRDMWRSEPENCLFRCIMRLDPTRPFHILGIGKVKSKQEWLEAIVRSNKSPEMIAAGPVNFMEVRKLDSWLHMKSQPEPEIGSRVGATLWQPSDLRFEEIAYIFDPTLPYSHTLPALDNLRLPPDERVGARTPAEVVAQAYGPAEGWRRGIPECYQSAFFRWQQGFLAAWMRQRGLNAAVQKAQEAAEELKDHPYAGFEAFLRALDGSAEKIKIRFDQREAANALNVPYRNVRSIRIPYTAEGPGMPFGALRLSFVPDGVSLEPAFIDARQGVAVVTVDSRLGIPVSKVPLLATLEVQGSNCKLEGERPVVRYRVLPSSGMATTYVAFGASMGMCLMLGARLLIGSLVGPGPVGMTVQPQDSPWNSIAAFLFAATWLYAGYRIWLMVLRRSEL